MSTEKMQNVLAKGKAVYNKGNEMMDKVPILKKPLYKKIVWGFLCLFCLLACCRILGCGGTQSPFDVLEETLVALPNGDIETIFSNMYIAEADRERLSKLSGSEAELLEKELVSSFVESFGSMSEENLSIMRTAFSTLRHKHTQIDGDWARVTFVLTVMGEEKEETHKLRKVDGEWKVVFD